MRKITKVNHNSISEIRAALNDLIEIFQAPKGSFEIRRIIVTKEGKLEVDYEEV